MQRVKRVAQRAGLGPAFDVALDYVRRAGFGQEYYEFWWKHLRRGEPNSRWAMEHQAFFVHIPKTAGTSLIEALDFEVNGYTHCPARSLKVIYPDLFETYFKFSVVRNPFDKFVSAFEYVTQKTDWSRQKNWSKRNVRGATFSEFVAHLQSSRSYRQQVLNYEFFLPQTFFLEDNNGKLLVDFLMRFESLNEDYNQLRKMRFPNAKQLPHARKNKNRGKWQDYYDETSEAFVKDYYAEDFERLNYTPWISSVSDAETISESTLEGGLNR